MCVCVYKITRYREKKTGDDDNGGGGGGGVVMAINGTCRKYEDAAVNARS